MAWIAFSTVECAVIRMISVDTLRAVATGWQVAGIYRKSSGAYLTASTGLDRALTGVGTATQRPKRLITISRMN